MKKLIGWIVVIVVLGLIIWAVSSTDNTQVKSDQSTGPIKIGFIGPLTGDASSLGVPSKNAVELAVSEINAIGGINGRQIELIAEDGQCATKAANNAANKLISIDGVSVIIGGLCSTETSSFASFANQNKVPVIAYCSSAPPLSKTGKYFFRDYPSDAFQGKFGAEYVYNTLGARKVAILYHVTDYGTGIKEVFKKRFTELGGQILIEEGTTQDTRDYKTQLSKINATNPDYIYTAMFPDGAIAMIGQYKSMGLKAKIFGGDIYEDTKLQQAIKGQADVLYTVPKTMENSGFDSRFVAKYPNSKVTTCVPQAYDALNIYAEAAAKVGTDPDKIQDELRKSVYQGVSGTIDFDENGDLTVADYVIKKVQNGSSVEVK